MASSIAIFGMGLWGKALTKDGLQMMLCCGDDALYVPEEVRIYASVHAATGARYGCCRPIARHIKNKRPISLTPFGKYVSPNPFPSRTLRHKGSAASPVSNDSGHLAP